MAAGGLFEQVPVPPDAARDGRLAGKPGTLVARGTDVVVESVALEAPTVVDGREVSAVFRVTVSAGPYLVRDMPAILSVDGTPVGVAAESVDLASLVLFSHDDVVVTDGATIALSYGLPGQAPADWSATLEVIQ